MQLKQLASCLAGSLVAFVSLGSNAATFQIDSTTSLVRTTFHNYPQWGHESDEIDAQLSGTFDLSTSPSGIDFFGASYPATITLTNIDVPTIFDNRSWTFPSFTGVIEDDASVHASDNPCSLWHGPGSCYSFALNTESYSGIFNGTKLVIDGTISGLYSPSSGINHYAFHIEATAVPEPSPIPLLCVGIGAMGLVARRYKLRTT